jgi:pyrroline-5-carboxylate reductase
MIDGGFMDFSEINTRGLVLLGCGKMGSALLEGWLKGGIDADAVYVLDPNPSDWVMAQGVHVNEDTPSSPAIALLAVKPQMMGDALPRMVALGNGTTLFLSIAAGTSIAHFEDALGGETPIVRSMPNTPAAVGKGITAIIGNAQATTAHLDMAEGLLHAVGQVVRLETEKQIDAVTGVSGSGPAYVFHLIEAMAAAGVAQGLPAGMAMQLAKATVAGAGALAEDADETPEQLRINVTSPGGTTAAALNVLMDEARGFPKLLGEAVKAATERGRELGK